MEYHAHMHPVAGGAAGTGSTLSTGTTSTSNKRASVISTASTKQQQQQRQPHHHGSGIVHKFERLVVVRAPPSQLRHPLNLQVQLINTSAGGGGGHSGNGNGNGNANGNATSAGGGRTAGHAGNSSTELSRSTTEGSFGAVAEASVSGLPPSSASVHDDQTALTTPSARTHSRASMSRTNSSESGISAAATSEQHQHQASEDTMHHGSLPGGGASLSRSASVRSNRSTTSMASSTASGTSALSMRKVLPCYNLEFHSLQPSVVTDAGTDAKIARIHKRGVELLDLALLDPVFVDQARDVPTLLQREESRRRAVEQSALSNGTAGKRKEGKAGSLAGAGVTGAGGAGGFAAADLKPTNLLNKFKRFSFKSGSGGGAASSVGDSLANASANTSAAFARPPPLQPTASLVPSGSNGQTPKENKRSSFLGFASFGSMAGLGSPTTPTNATQAQNQLQQQQQAARKPAGTAAASSSSSLAEPQVAPPAPVHPFVVPAVPLFRDKSSLDPDQALIKGAPEGLNVRIKRHAPGYAWVVRHWIRADILAAGLDGIAEVSVEWRKKRRRGARGRDGNHHHHQRSAHADRHQEGGDSDVQVRDLAAARAQSRASSRRNSLQMPRASVDGSAAAVTASGQAGTTSPPRAAVVPSTHVHTPSNDAEAGTPTSSRGGTRSFEINRSRSGAAGAPQEPEARTDGGSAAGGGAGGGRNAAAMLNANSLGRHRTAPHLGTASPSDRQPSHPAAVAAESPRRTDSLPLPGSGNASSAAAVTANAGTAGQGRSASPVSFAGTDGESGRQSRQSSHATRPVSVVGSSMQHDPVDEGEESDPEDSERPWMCELVIKRPVPSLILPAADAGGRTSQSTTYTTQRILLGTLTPAPHHPKLVAHLAIPLTLAPVDLLVRAADGHAASGDNTGASGKALSRSATLSSTASSQGGRGSRAPSPSVPTTTSAAACPAEVVITSEEMKDLMTVTGLWLVVRENLGLGGIHKARKNDGAWRFATPAALKAG